MTIQDSETDSDSQLLDRVLPAIALLEASLADEREASHDAVLSAHLLDMLTDLGHAIAEESEETDALDLIAPRSWAAEELHSRIISWLLDPSAHHRQAGHYIAALLNATMAPPRLLDADWSAAQSHPGVAARRRRTAGLSGHPGPGPGLPPKPHRHRKQDLLPRAQQPAHPLPPRSGRGLSRLRQTPHLPVPPPVVPPSLDRDRKHWRPASYSVMHNAIQEILETGVAEPNANALLQIYATTIRRNVMPDTSIDRRARRIYLEHREALDRIFANKPNWIEETKPMLIEAIAKYPCWKLDNETPQFVRFRATDWDEFLSSRTGTGWAPTSHALLLFQLRFDDEVPYLDLGLSTADPENAGIRAALFDAVRENPGCLQTHPQQPQGRLDDPAQGTRLYPRRSRLRPRLGRRLCPAQDRGLDRQIRHRAVFPK